MENYQNRKRFVAGVLILIAGLALLLSNLGLLDYEIKRYILRWEAILVGIGIVSILTHTNKGPGIILLVIGGALYMKEFFELSFQFKQLFWPSILILAGILILFKQKGHKHHLYCEKNKFSDDDTIDEFAVFGGGDRTIVSQNFGGGRILAIFGGSNFNLTRAKLAPGKNYIDVLAIFGGMKLVVPEDWNVKVKAISIFGGFSDKHRIHQPNSDSSQKSELIIKGLVIFGGGEIKSF